LGVHKNTVLNYERGDRFPDANILLKILDLFPGTNPAWLLTGEGARQKSVPVKEGFVVFSCYEIDGGSVLESHIESDQIVDHIAFKEEWIQNFLGVPQKDLALLAMKGDGMTPSLSDGDMVLVDLRTSRIEDSAIYVLQYENALLVKRVQKKMDGSVIIKGDNQVYEPEILSKERADSLKIVGRVVWAGKRM
jgi:transcriptional regulator with XRE-family HTH domain